MRAFQNREQKTLRPCGRRCLYAVMACCVVLSGCTRKFFREATDNDVQCLLTEKNQYPEWGLKNWYTYPDGRSRFADPTNPDHPPKPWDDPAARDMSPNPQPHVKKNGTFEGTIYLDYLARYDAENRTVTKPTKAAEATTEDPELKALDSRGPKFLLNMDQCTELALFNSREYQNRREDLYASALPVSLQRFAFAPQWFFNTRWIREHNGDQVTGSGGSKSWTGNTNAGFSWLFPTGANLLVQLANQVVIDLGRGRPAVSLSRLSVDLSQPFLQGGGQTVTLEPVTQAERDLLYAIRSFARFRKLHYVYLLGGTDLNSDITLAGIRNLGGSFDAPSQGYLPTLLLLAQERNERENIARLKYSLKLYQALSETPDVSQLQVDQVEQQLLRGKSSLLQRRQSLDDALDQFKLQLGIPVSLGIELDDSPLNPVQDQLTRYGRIREQFDGAIRMAETTRRAALILGGGGLAEQIRLRSIAERLMADSPLVQKTKFREEIQERWRKWSSLDNASLDGRMTTDREMQRKLLDEKAVLELAGKKLSADGESRLQELRYDINLGRFEQSLRLLEGNPGSGPALRTIKLQESYFREAIGMLALVLGEARDQRLDSVEDEWPALPTVSVDGLDLLKEDLDSAQSVAGQTALRNRLELMNQRGQLVDAWRQIAVRANGLLGIFNVGYHMDTTSPLGKNEPLNLGGSRTRNQLILDAELPLVRRSERNSYRTAQLLFQRQRRSLQVVEDIVQNDVRTELRQLRVLAERYKIQKRVIALAFSQVENAQDVLQAPPDPRQAQSGQSAGSAAALTNQLLNAQNSLLTAQNDLFNIWITYTITRLQLFRDLELLQLDENGMRIEAGSECEKNSAAHPVPALPEPEAMK